MKKHIGAQSIRFENKISVYEAASIVGPKEGEGPLRDCFDEVRDDIMSGEDTWEKAESVFIRDTIELLINKANVEISEIDYILAGDLLNQSISTTFGIKGFERPFFGIFGACSTIGEGMGLAAIILDGGFADKVIVSASSHFCAAEKQFRFPLELGTQRTPTSSWTVTGNGSVLLSIGGRAPYVTGITTGKIVDLGIKDVNNMGASMAPAAADTLINHFHDFNCKPSDYDIIVTGDLGHIGRELVVQMLEKEGYDLSSNYTDCGIEIFDRETQDTHAGGSGCACSAVTFAGRYLQKLRNKEIKKMLLIPTGALISPTSSQQGQSMPGIAHAVIIEN